MSPFFPLSPLLPLLKVEEAHGILGARAPGDAGADVALWSAEIIEANARRSEALALCEPGADPVQRARALLFRGRIEDAHRALDAARAEADPTELLVESARVAQAEGHWSEAAVTIERALELRPPAITQLTLLQMLALSRLETGELGSAADALARAESLSEIFPTSATVPYLWALRAKIAARVQGADAALAVLDRAWARLLALGLLNADSATALLRAQVDALQRGSRPALRAAAAAYRIELAMGEELYAALAAIDCARVGGAAVRAALASELADGARRFARARRGLAEMEAAAGMAAAAAAAPGGAADTAASARATPAPGLSLAQFLAARDAHFIVLARPRLLVRVEPWVAFSLAEFPRLEDGIRALRAGPLSREAFAREVWGVRAFSREKHGNLAPGLAYRLKKWLGEPVLAVGAEIAFPRALYVD